MTVEPRPADFRSKGTIVVADQVVIPVTEFLALDSQVIYFQLQNHATGI
jgi:hypothetical protein